MNNELSIKEIFQQQASAGQFCIQQTSAEQFGMGQNSFSSTQILDENNPEGHRIKAEKEAKDAEMMAYARHALDAELGNSNEAIWGNKRVSLNGTQYGLGKVAEAVQEINKDFDETIEHAQRCGRMRGMSRRDIDRMRRDVVEVDAELASVRAGNSTPEAAIQRLESINPEAAELVAWQLEGRPSAPAATINAPALNAPAIAAPSMIV